HSAAMAESAQSTPIFLAQGQNRTFGRMRGPLSPGGPSFLTAYRLSSFPPLVVAVSLAEKDVLAGWWHVSMLAVGLTAALGIALLLAAYLIMRESRRRTKAASRLIAADAAPRARQLRPR